MEEQILITPWNIFDRVHYKDDSTTQYEFTEYKERNSNVTGLTEYNMSNQDLYIPLMISDSFLQVKCSIVRADNYINLEKKVDDEISEERKVSTLCWQNPSNKYAVKKY